MASFCNGLWLQGKRLPTSQSGKSFKIFFNLIVYLSQAHVYYQFLPQVFTSKISKKFDLVLINYILDTFHAVTFGVIMIIDYEINTPGRD